MTHFTRRQTNASEEGAAMLVVMFILLMGTATALYGMHSTSFEMRASGHSRRAMQTQYVAESALQATAAYYSQIGGAHQDPNLQPGAPGVDFAPFEPAPLAGTPITRKYQNDFDRLFAGGAGTTLETASSVGPRQSWSAGAIVDVVSLGENNMAEAGRDVARSGTTVVATSRGRIRLGDRFDTPTDVTSGIEGDRGWHESAIDARAIMNTPGDP